MCIENDVPKLTTAPRKSEGRAKLLAPVEDDGDEGLRLKKVLWHPAEPRYITNDNARR
jgi:hypothetical protein